MTSKFSVALVAAFLAATCAEAHDTWVQTNANLIRPEDQVFIDLMLGNHGNDHHDFKLASKVNPTRYAEVVGPTVNASTSKIAQDVGYTPTEGLTHASPRQWVLLPRYPATVASYAGAFSQKCKSRCVAALTMLPTTPATIGVACAELVLWCILHLWSGIAAKVTVQGQTPERPASPSILRGETLRRSSIAATTPHRRQRSGRIHTRRRQLLPRRGSYAGTQGKRQGLSEHQVFRDTIRVRSADLSLLRRMNRISGSCPKLGGRGSCRAEKSGSVGASPLPD